MYPGVFKKNDNKFILTARMMGHSGRFVVCLSWACAPKTICRSVCVLVFVLLYTYTPNAISPVFFYVFLSVLEAYLELFCAVLCEVSCTMVVVVLWMPFSLFAYYYVGFLVVTYLSGFVLSWLCFFRLFLIFCAHF